MDKQFEYYVRQLDGEHGARLSVLMESADGKWKAFRISKHPDHFTMSADIIFTPNQIILTGDVRPVRGGCMSDFGYGLDWFASRLDSSYLSEKFLQKKWSQVKAINAWQERIEQYKVEKAEHDADPENSIYDPNLMEEREWTVNGDIIKGTVIEALSAFVDEASDTLCDARAAYERLPGYRPIGFSGNCRCPFDSEEAARGYGYDDVEVGWLVAIQHIFAREYAKLKGAQ